MVLLQTAQVTAIGESMQLPVRVLLDSGNQLSYINQLTRKVKAQIHTEGETQCEHVW